MLTFILKPAQWTPFLLRQASFLPGKKSELRNEPNNPFVFNPCVRRTQTNQGSVERYDTPLLGVHLDSRGSLMPKRGSSMRRQSGRGPTPSRRKRLARSISFSYVRSPTLVTLR